MAARIAGIDMNKEITSLSPYVHSLSFVCTRARVVWKYLIMDTAAVRKTDVTPAAELDANPHQESFKPVSHDCERLGRRRTKLISTRTGD